MSLRTDHLVYPGEFNYKGFYYGPWYTLDIIKKIEDDDIFLPDDLLISTFPKSGTTLTQEIVWLIMNGVDTEKAKQSHLYCRMPFIDLKFTTTFPPFDGKHNAIDILDQWPSPRILKTHLNFRNLQHQLDKKPSIKSILVLRNPKDTLVSTYHFYHAFLFCDEARQENWDTFFERWMNGYINTGDWLEVTKEKWLHRDRTNVKIVFYEDLVKRKAQTIHSLCDFLNVHLTEDQINKIVHHTDFENMKSNPMTNYKNVGTLDPSFSFMRKGQVGDWKNYFTVAQSERMDEKYKDTLEEIGLRFQYE